MLERKHPTILPGHTLLQQSREAFFSLFMPGGHYSPSVNRAIARAVAVSRDTEAGPLKAKSALN